MPLFGRPSAKKTKRDDKLPTIDDKYTLKEQLGTSAENYNRIIFFFVFFFHHRGGRRRRHYRGKRLDSSNTRASYMVILNEADACVRVAIHINREELVNPASAPRSDINPTRADEYNI
ncbi:unnamed protein product [Trichogramma brassicae]|uniref:Uncharacterized protein n=1 Tax=Trichogramma brassicae TaxID=86971 RepID=A0A6H5IHH1_9HYME|nr:unnamed protein product [Trichogramma brassicae]